MAKTDRANLSHILLRRVETVPDKPAIYEPIWDSSGIKSYKLITYIDLKIRSGKLANSLLELGLKPGDRILVMVPMSIALYEIMLACLKAGIIIVFIDPWVGFKKIREFALQTSPRAFISTMKGNILRWIPGILPSFEFNITIGKSLFGLGTYSLEELIENNSEECDIYEVEEDYPALITFTTGSTGIPKGVERSHGFLFLQHQILTEHLGTKREDIDLTMLPVFVLNSLANGSTSVLPAMDTRNVSRAEPALLAQQFKDMHITTSVASPIVFEKLVTHMASMEDNFPEVRALYTGGAPVSRELIISLKNIVPNGKVYILYGSTEAEPIASISAEEILEETVPPTEIGLGLCVGLPDPNIEIGIIPASEENLDSLNLLPIGETGEIAVCGPHVNKGYYKNPIAEQQNKIKLENGSVWHRTGDAGYVDKNGRLFLLGRISQRITREDKIYYPLQIEPVINTLESVEKSAYFTVSNGLIVLAYTDNGKSVVTAENAIRKKIEELNLPCDKIIRVKEIPMDPRHNSKINYIMLRKSISRRKFGRYFLK